MKAAFLLIVLSPFSGGFGIDNEVVLKVYHVLTTHDGRLEEILVGI